MLKKLNLLRGKADTANITAALAEFNIAELEAGLANAPIDRTGRVVVRDPDHRPEQVALARAKGPPPDVPAVHVGDQKHRLDQAGRGVLDRAPIGVDAAALVDHGEGSAPGAALEEPGRVAEPLMPREPVRWRPLLGRESVRGRRAGQRQPAEEDR